MSRRRGLGSGLDALIPTTSAGQQAVRDLPVAAIRANRSQPRTSFDEQALAELVESIQAHGVIQPLIVSEDTAGGYELIAGERRLRAARLAGMTSVPAIIKSATPQQLLELALVENVQRADLNALEEAQAYDTLRREFGLSDEEVARRVGKSRVTVVNSRRLLRLSAPARQALLDGAISAGHGRALLRLERPDQQQAALELATHRDLSVRELERLAELALSGGLADDVRAALLSGAISGGQAQALLRIEERDLQSAAMETALTRGLSLRDTERLCALVAEGVPLAAADAELRGRPAPARPAAPAPAAGAGGAASPEDHVAQQLFEELLQTPVQIARSGRSIRLTITLYDDEQLQAIYERLGGGS